MQEQFWECRNVLKLASDLIDVEGLAKGSMYRADQGYCSVGAISFAATGAVPESMNPGELRDPLAQQTVVALRAYLQTADMWGFAHHDSFGLAYPVDSVISWNDYTATKDEVVSAFRSAAQWIESVDA
jgi:hypothetical protein